MDNIKPSTIHGVHTYRWDPRKVFWLSEQQRRISSTQADRRHCDSIQNLKKKKVLCNTTHMDPDSANGRASALGAGGRGLIPGRAIPRR